MTDAELVQLFVTERSHDAFESLVSRHAGWVCSLARRRVRDEHLAHDVTQVVFMLLARRAGTLRDKSRLTAWLTRVTYYASQHAIREESRRRRREQAVARSTPATAHMVRESDVYAALDRAIAELPTRDRELIGRRFYQNQSLATVGGALGISADAARKRLNRVLTRLRARLVNHDFAGDPASLLASLGAFAAVTPMSDFAALSRTALAPASASSRCQELFAGAVKMMIRSELKLMMTVASIVIVALSVSVFAVHSLCYEDFDEPPVVANVPTTSATSPPGPQEISTEDLLLRVSSDGTKLIGYSLASGRWSIAPAIDEPLTLTHAIVSSHAALYVAKHQLLAFSPDTGTWDSLTLPAAVDKEPQVYMKSIMVHCRGQLYVFTSATGKWSDPLP